MRYDARPCAARLPCASSSASSSWAAVPARSPGPPATGSITAGTPAARSTRRSTASPPDNVGSLRIVWRRPAVDAAVRAAHPKVVVPDNYRATPLKAGGLLYASNGLGVAEAFDPATGRTVWTQAVPPDELAGAGASRNLAYWTGPGRRPRLQRARPQPARRRRAHRQRASKASAIAARSICSPGSATRRPASAGRRRGRWWSATW